MRKIIVAITILGLSGAASATPARVEALSGNPGFVDNSDPLLYPSTIAPVGDAVNLNYGVAQVDGGATFAGGKMLHFSRDGLAPNAPGPGTPGSWMAVYGQGDGSTGWLTRTSWVDDKFTVGGVWGKGGWDRTTSNLAIGGDISMLGDAAADEKKWAVNLQARGRNLQENKLMAWNAGLLYDTDSEAVGISGGLALGPRWVNDKVRAAIAVGPALQLVSVDDSLPLTLNIPVANVAAEYNIKEWLLLRGSTTAGWSVSAGDSAEFTDTETWSSQVGGMVGLGFKRDTAQFDMAVNPGWLVGGPFLLSGAAAPMFATVSGRIAL